MNLPARVRLLPHLVSGWSAALILLLEFGFFALLLAPRDGGPHTFASVKK